MATLIGTFGIEGTAQYNAGSAVSGLMDRIRVGQQGFDCDQITLKYGTADTLDAGALRVNDWYAAEHTISAGATLSLDLNGNSTYKNPFGVTLAFTKIKFVLVSVQDPDGVKYVKVGPQNEANAAQLWFGGVGAHAYDAVYWHTAKGGPIAGWAITAGTGDILPIINPGGSSVTVVVFIAGVK